MVEACGAGAAPGAEAGSAEGAAVMVALAEDPLEEAARAEAGEVCERRGVKIDGPQTGGIRPKAKIFCRREFKSCSSVRIGRDRRVSLQTFGPQSSLHSRTS